MFSSPCRQSGGAVRRTWPTHGLGKWEVPAGDKFSREVVRKVKHSSVRIENPLLALYRDTGYFSLARTFRTVLGARTQETVGGPNGAQRSEFRRTAPPDNNDIVLSQCFPAMSYVSVVGHACMALTMLQGHLTWQRMSFTWWFCHTNMPQMHLHDHVAYPARGISQSSGRDESHHKRLRSYVLTCFHQSGRRHGHLCNTLIIKYHLFRAWITEDFLTTNPHRILHLIINQAIAKTDVAPSRQQA